MADSALKLICINADRVGDMLEAVLCQECWQVGADLGRYLRAFKNGCTHELHQRSTIADFPVRVFGVKDSPTADNREPPLHMIVCKLYQMVGTLLAWKPAPVARILCEGREFFWI